MSRVHLTVDETSKGRGEVVRKSSGNVESISNVIVTPHPHPYPPENFFVALRHWYRPCAIEPPCSARGHLFAVPVPGLPACYYRRQPDRETHRKPRSSFRDWDVTTSIPGCYTGHQKPCERSAWYVSAKSHGQAQGNAGPNLSSSLSRRDRASRTPT